ncbi:MAG: TetR/AcrR family transcriptional regulator [Rhodocyclaceae bacterium]|nr:TetR/AcrR family transcriptional regulator [Rhodocyclaceae bacterium]
MRARGMQISPSGVRYIWVKHGLETVVKRLETLARGDVDRLSEEERRLLERGQKAARLSLRGDADDAEGGEPLSRQQLILHAAAELFASQGYDRTSIRDIAAKVGLLPGSVYHHFPSKEDIYLGVYREGFRRIMARVREAAAAGRDPWDRLQRACEVHVSGLVEGEHIERLTGHSLAMIDDHEVFDKIRGDRNAYEQVFRELIEALPLAPGADRTLLRLTLLGAMNWVAIWYRAGKYSSQQIADTMVAMLRRGVSGGA